MNHVDYFKNPIEVGDIVLRNCNGTHHIAQVVRITPNRIGLLRQSWQHKSRYNYITKQWITEKIDKPLYVTYFSGINLSKLDSSKIQETINKFINEI